MSEVFTGEWYPWYPKKALTSEGIDGLTLTEEGAYRRALDKAWLKGSIPSDPKDAAKVIGKGCSVKIATRVLELFTPIQGNKKRSVNLPQERYRAEQAERHRKAVERATNAANARHNKSKGADATSNPQAIGRDAIEIDIDIEKEVRKEDVCVGAISVEEREHQDKILDGLRSRMKLNIIRDEQGWSEAAEWSMLNHFSDSQFLECYDLLTKQKWRKGRVTPKNVCENIHDLPKLRDEIRDQENANRPNGNRQRNPDDTRTAADVARDLGVGI